MTEVSTLPAGVGLTALGTAQERRLESARTDPLFTDHLAGRFLDHALAGIATPPFDKFAQGYGLGDVQPALRGYVALRTSFIDAHLSAAAIAGTRQVVLLAAGLDARAFRLPWPPGTHLYEVDTPDLLAFKQKVLDSGDGRPACTRAAVAADLRADWVSPLRDACFDSAQPTAWVAEGLMMYLPQAVADALLTQARQLSAEGSTLVLDHFLPAVLDGERGTAARAELDRLGASLMSTVDDPVSWLGGHGWTAERADATALAAGRGRAVPPVLDPASPRVWLAEAVASPADGR